MLANQIQQYRKRIIYHEQVEFIPAMQEWFNLFKKKSICVIYHINRKPHNPLNRKCIGQTLTSFMIKTLNNLGIKGNFLNFLSIFMKSPWVKSYLC